MSVLWRSTDGMRTWKDPGARTGGRHSAFAKLEDSSILALGGKDSDIDGFMPQFRSNDLGDSWEEAGKTPFASLGSNQRPALIRLQSGRLFFAGDMQERGGDHPEKIKERGVLIGLSEDGGKTWITKQLPGVLPHKLDKPDWGTLGYVVARQADNGIIHIGTSSTEPALHFELNEAWILTSNTNEDMGKETLSIQTESVQKYQESWPDGKPRHIWHGGFTQSGEFLLHGEESWFFPDGRLQYQAKWDSGYKVEKETLWDDKGNRIWEWKHHPDGTATWRQFYKNGRLKAESIWQNKRIKGIAKRWDSEGKLLTKWNFSEDSSQSMPINK